MYTHHTAAYRTNSCTVQHNNSTAYLLHLNTQIFFLPTADIL